MGCCGKYSEIIRFEVLKADFAFSKADRAEICRNASLRKRLRRKTAAGSPAAHICGRGGIGRLDGFRFRYLSGVRVRVPPPAPRRRKRYSACGGIFLSRCTRLYILA